MLVLRRITSTDLVSYFHSNYKGKNNIDFFLFRRTEPNINVKESYKYAPLNIQLKNEQSVTLNILSEVFMKDMVHTKGYCSIT